MNKGFIPIIFIVVGAVVVASAVFGVVRYKDELSQVPAAVMNIFMGKDEPIQSPEDIEASKKEIKEIAKEERMEDKAISKQEKKGPRIVKGPKTGPKQEKPEKQIEEIQEQQEQEIEVIEEDVLTISNINVDINKIPIDPVVITWITNKESNTSLEYGLSSGSYDWLLHNSISKETDAGFLHAIYLYAEFNRVYHYRVSSADSDRNKVESENMTFTKFYYPFNVPCNPPGQPIVTSHTNGQIIGVGDDENGDMPGVQIELKGIAAAKGRIFISINSLYETPVGENGRWEQEDITLEDGKNTLHVKVRNILNCENHTTLTLYVDSEAPLATIWISDQVGNDFTVNWSSSEDNSTFDVRMKVGKGGGWDYPEWGIGTEELSQDFVDAEGGTYRFEVKATDPAGNIGDWAETQITI